MQNDYILMSWDSICQNHIWYETEIVEQNVATNQRVNNNVFDSSLEIAILGLLIYNIIVIIFLSIRNEKVLHRKNKIVEKGQ